MNAPSTGKKILAVIAGVLVMALAATLVFMLMETIFGAAEGTGDKEDKYRLFSSRASWSFYIALFISAFLGAAVCLAVAKARLLNLALVTALTPLAIITLSMLFDKEGGKQPDEGILIMAAALAAGAILAWALKKKPSIIND